MSFLIPLMVGVIVYGAWALIEAYKGLFPKDWGDMVEEVETEFAALEGLRQIERHNHE